MRLEERPAGERARQRVHEACSPECIAHEFANFIDRQWHDQLRDVSERDLFLRALQRLHFIHTAL